MKRWFSAAVAALVGALTLAAVAAAAVAPGTYKGNIYAGTTKGAAATVVVAGTKVTITVAKFPIKCLGPSGGYTQVAAPMKYVWKGTLKANKIAGNYRNPLGGTGEYFTAKGTFTVATKSFAGTLGFVGMCRGTSAVKAKKA